MTRANPHDWLKAHAEHQGDDCLLWPFCCDRQGYPLVFVNGKTKWAHHEMCQLAHGPRPSARHKAARSCGGLGSKCVSPTHTNWRTESEIQTAANARRRAAGTYKPVRWKLTRAQVQQIQDLKPQGNSRRVAVKFGVDRQTIRLIWTKRPYYRSIERERVYDALVATATTMSIRQLMAATKTSYLSVTNILRKLIEENSVVRISRGRYRVPLTTRVMRKVTVAVRGAVPITMPRQVREEVIQDLLLSFVEGTVSLLELREAVVKSIRKYYQTYPNRFGPRSLDAPMRNGLTLHDLLSESQP